jgi:hypothetical protein
MTNHEPQDSNNLEQPVSRVETHPETKKPVKTPLRRHEGGTTHLRLDRQVWDEARELGMSSLEVEIIIEAWSRRTRKARGLPARPRAKALVSIACDTRLSVVLQGDTLSLANLERAKALKTKARRVAQRRRELEAKSRASKEQ